MRKMIDRNCEKCDKIFTVREYYVRRGNGRFCSRSCAKLGVNNPAYRHGNAPRSEGQSKEYQTWGGVKKRILHGNPLNRQYYKEKGIKMCDRWFNSFDNFLEDMGKAPSNKHQIDRIDGDGDYEPGNCRWVTRVEQMNNVSTNVRLTYDGMTLTQAQWGRKTGIGQNVICRRLKRGWSVEKSLTTKSKRLAP